jgi:hypothetical protein
MIVLHNAVVPFDGDEIVINEPDKILSFTIDHTLDNSDAVRIEMESGTIYMVTESVDEIEAMMEASKNV